VKKLFVLVAAVVLVMAASCDTLNLGNDREPGRGPVIEGAAVTSATTMNGGEPGTLTVPWTSGTAPFTIAITINGVTVVPAGTAAGTSPYTFDFTLEEGTDIPWTVAMLDANGQGGDANGTYTAGPVLNARPTIDNVAVAGAVVTVTVADVEGDDVTVTASDIAGMTLATGSVVVAGGNGDAVFTFTNDDPMVDVTGTTNIEAQDTEHTDMPATDTATVSIDALELLPTEGQIGAHLMSGTAAVGDTVTVLVVAGDFPAGAAFNYMNGVGVTVTDGGDYVDDTFNVGSIGGAQKDVDGIWADMAPAPSTFFVPENFMMKATDVAADGSLDFMGFNITPIGAGEVTGGGDLFNFGIAFDAAGTYELGFLEFQDVKRTYYSDNAAVEYNWPDITNVVTNLNSTITVN